MSDPLMPSPVDLMLVTLQVLKKRGGSAGVQEILTDAPNLLNIPDEILEVPHGRGPASEFNYLASLMRTCLKQAGYVENSSRGVWSSTPRGQAVLAHPEAEARAELQQARSEVLRAYRQRRQGRDAGPAEEAVATEAEDPEARVNGDDGWEETLLATLKEMDPEAFERLCQRVLRESGFTKVEVTDRSGDGGIDGTGVLRVNLISFQVVFQCKRYAETVGDSYVRNLRGAMSGRGADKGLLLTTGRFSRPAEAEASRALPTIELIDGTELCRLLKSLDLGVRTEAVEKVTVDREFFESI